MRGRRCAFGLFLVLVAGAVRADVVHPLPYDLLYVRAPWFGAGSAQPNSVWPDTVRPLTPDPGAQLTPRARRHDHKWGSSGPSVRERV